MQGGAWTKAHLGVEADAIKAYASGGQAQEFCSVYGLTKQATLSIRKYTEKVASGLALLWCAGCLHSDCVARVGLLSAVVACTLVVPLARRQAINRVNSGKPSCPRCVFASEHGSEFVACFIFGKGGGTLAHVHAFCLGGTC